jgi:hypothetical protein
MRTIIPGWKNWLAAALSIAFAAASAAANEPNRTDHGDLILLDVYGSYEEMGRQAAELLGEDARIVYELNAKLYRRTLQRGLAAWLFDRVLLPVGVRFMSDDTGAMEEARGYARGLGVSRTDYMRSQIGAGAAAGSTVFAATRSATADGNALLGRNVDWTDFDGRLKPTAIRFHPDNGDFDYVSVAWPLLPIPTVGLNEEALAFSFNYFATDPQMVTTSTSYPYRRILQKASSVAEAIELFQSDFPIIMSVFGALADAAGDIALLECTTRRCEVFRPEGDWFAHSNHARTESMLAVDLFRGPDSLDRRRLMERAVESHLGRLDAARAAQILRDRNGHEFANASVVGNLFVLNAAIVEPAKRTLWHSDAMQPYAPFGAYVPIAIGGANGAAPAPGGPIPASRFLETEAYRREAAAVARVRAAQNAHVIDEDVERANELWAALFADPPNDLDLAPISLGWALSLVAAGRFDDATAALDAHVGTTARREERAAAALLKGTCADGLGRRDAAVAQYEAAAALMAEVPDQTSYASMRSLAAEGRRRALAPDEVDLSWWITHVPR